MQRQMMNKAMTGNSTTTDPTTDHSSKNEHVSLINITNINKTYLLGEQKLQVLNKSRVSGFK